MGQEGVEDPGAMRGHRPLDSWSFFLEGIRIAKPQGSSGSMPNWRWQVRIRQSSEGRDAQIVPMVINVLSRSKIHVGVLV